LATLELPVVLENSATAPVAVFQSPLVLFCNAPTPVAVLYAPHPGLALKVKQAALNKQAIRICCFMTWLRFSS
jgi:hypothetical protein